MAKKVLFIGTPYMQLYKEIIIEFEKRGYSVDFLKERFILEDPDNLRGGSNLRYVFKRMKFEEENQHYWRYILDSETYNKKYDVLFVLDGQSLHPVLFSILRKRNPHLFAVNYLFDTTREVYRFDKNFKYFDRVATFDIGESQKYGIMHLPIFWVPQANNPKDIHNVFFGIGAFKHDRLFLYERIADFAKSSSLNYVLKLFSEPIKHHKFKHLVRTVFHIQKDRITPKEAKSEIITSKVIPLHEFNYLLCSSMIVVDTSAPSQDGLTSRFMTALGMRKKIVTTNVNVRKYSFFNEENIYVVDNVYEFNPNQHFVDFVTSSFCLKYDLIKEIDKYRIDSWLNMLLTN